MTAEDVPWLRYLGAKRYPDRFEIESSVNWFLNIVLKNPMLFLAVRSPNAFLIQMISTLPWFPNEFQCNVVFIAADDDSMWEAIHLLRYGIEWGKRRRCADWRLAGDAEYDMGPIARRLLATEIQPRWVLSLR